LDTPTGHVKRIAIQIRNADAILCVQDTEWKSSEGETQMIITRRGVVSVEDATAKLDALARRCGIANPRYEESEADSMSEFDALEWICLCSQRVALQQRENENSSRVPPNFQCFYGTKHCSTPKPLVNTDDGQLSLAA
jgi:hypothetical protein